MKGNVRFAAGAASDYQTVDGNEDFHQDLAADNLSPQHCSNANSEH